MNENDIRSRQDPSCLKESDDFTGRLVFAQQIIEGFFDYFLMINQQSFRRQNFQNKISLNDLEENLQDNSKRIKA
jgi:hypothetical protein